MTSSPAAPVAVEVAKLLDVAVNVWRLDRWIARADAASSGAGRYALRGLQDFLRNLEIEVVDLTGQRYEPGLALEVIGTLKDATLAPGVVLVDEMVSPLCTLRGVVVRHGQVVTRSASDSAPDPK